MGKMNMRGRKDIRLKNYNYRSNGYYFITAVTKLRGNIFAGKENLVEMELQDTLQKIPGAQLDYFVIMPNHIHVIIILQTSQYHIGEIVRRFKAKVSHKFGFGIWQANYYEHIIRNEAALYKIREYIKNNPAALLLKFEEFYDKPKPINGHATTHQIP